MPKILIREYDQTSPGTPDAYSNYKVLITGAKVTTDADSATVQPDSNGVYEFSSVQDFVDTIGRAAPDAVTTETDKDNGVIIYHYGNQMAYELLKMGYSIIYKPIQGDEHKSAIHKMDDENFWEVFKDKANYDFRFISHGLLKSSVASVEYEGKKERLKAVDLAASKLAEILSKAKQNNPDATDQSAEVTEDCQEAYQEIYDEISETFTNNASYESLADEYKGFIDINNLEYSIYEDYSQAVTGTTAEKAELDLYETEYQAKNVNDTIINNINGHIANLASYTESTGSGTTSGRGDCIALIELDENSYNSTASSENSVSQIITAIKKMNQITKGNGTYCALTVPSVTYQMDDDSNFDNNKTFPGAFHYLACFMNALKSGFNEWYAAAGYTRGVSNYTIVSTAVKLGEIAINALEPRKKGEAGATEPSFACNVIANFRGSYYLWGNRTAHPLDANDLVAKHFLNIRQLCITIKKQLYTACRRFTFDPNSDTLWVNFVNAIKPTLEAMKADQGIRDYKVLKVYEENPKKATLKAKIRIIPIEAVEDFDIEVRLEDSFGETTVVAD